MTPRTNPSRPPTMTVYSLDGAPPYVQHVLAVQQKDNAPQERLEVLLVLLIELRRNVSRKRLERTESCWKLSSKRYSFLIL